MTSSASPQPRTNWNVPRPVASTGAALGTAINASLYASCTHTVLLWWNLAAALVCVMAAVLVLYGLNLKPGSHGSRNCGVKRHVSKIESVWRQSWVYHQNL